MGLDPSRSGAAAVGSGGVVRHWHSLARREGVLQGRWETLGNGGECFGGVSGHGGAFRGWLWEIETVGEVVDRA